ncbi:MAG: tRNA lysidine(34) synthetase TilS [Flavobacteriales bacterium]
MRNKVRAQMRGSGVLPGGSVQVGVSGGVDSMVLAHLLKELGFSVSIFHVDHGLRGDESAGDRAFVEAFASSEGIPYAAVEADVNGRHAEGGASVQMAARELRYRAFRDLLGNGGCLALAHHRDDAVETLLLNLMRGTGPAGWAGIPWETPLGAGKIVRPLLGIGRAAIKAYALENIIPFREDSSNSDPKYLRNRVRHEVLPLVEEMRPGSLRTMGRSLNVLREMADLAMVATSERITRLPRDTDGNLLIPFTELGTGNSPLLLLGALFSGEDAHPDELAQLLAAVHGRSVGKRFAIGEKEVIVDRDHLLVLKARSAEEIQPVTIPEATTGGSNGFAWGLVSPAGIDLGTGLRTAWLDADRLHFPLVLRPWRHGDRMRPVGLSGSKLISDILTDSKVPHEQRASARVLLSGEEIAWLVGVRIGDGYPAGEDAERVFRIQAH